MAQKQTHLRLGEILIACRVITEEQLQEALAAQAESNKPIGAILIERNMAEPYEVAQAVARQVGLLAVNLDTFKIDSDAIGLLPVELCHRYDALVVQVHGDLVLVAMAHPRNDEAYAAIREAIAPKRVRCLVANEHQIRERLSRLRTQPVGASSA